MLEPRRLLWNENFVKLSNLSKPAKSHILRFWTESRSAVFFCAKNGTEKNTLLQNELIYKYVYRKKFIPI